MKCEEVDITISLGAAILNYIITTYLSLGFQQRTPWENVQDFRSLRNNLSSTIALVTKSGFYSCSGD